MEEKIFKAYDIRGIFPEELNEDAAYKIGRAFVSFLTRSTDSGQAKDKPKIVIGMDNRLSSGVLSIALQKGITEQGGDVVDLGFCTTPMFYFAAAKNDYDGGLMITASHNPPQYNGFKMVNKGGVPISGATGIEEIKKLALTNDFIPAVNLGNKEKKDILSDYVEATQSSESFDYTIIVDTANSISGIPVKKMLGKTGLIHIFDELDGNFPNHEANPLTPKLISNNNIKENIFFIYQFCNCFSYKTLTF
jgi:phosphomannomutase